MNTKRQTPRKYGEVVGLGERNLKGLDGFGEDLGVRATPAAVMRTVLNGVTQSQREYRLAVAAAVDATAEQDVHMRKAATFITLVRENLKPTLGSRYNMTWGTVGLFSGTLAVPRTLPRRLTLLLEIRDFFLRHPELEIPKVVTAALAAALFQSLSDAMAAATAAKVAQRQLKVVRDGAVAVLRQRIQGLRAELKLLLSPSDPRWLDFGFKVPTDVSVPESPAEVKVTVDSTNHAKASWGHTVHADRYRVYQRVVGTDAEPVLMDTTSETSFDLGTFAAGTELEVQVAAVNSAGEGRKSDVVRFVIPKEE